jgi:diguanylate cyclase (GGDEF)-like protein
MFRRAASSADALSHPGIPGTDKYRVKRVPAIAVPAFAVAAGLPTAIAPDSTTATVSYAVAFTVLVALGWVRLRALTGAVRRGYAFIVGALTLWLTGDLLYDLLDRVAGPFGGVSPSDALWVSGYVLVALGLVRLTRLRAPGRLREGMLDGLAMATVVAWLFWQYQILPAIEHERMSLQVAFDVFYPFGDVLLFATTAILVLSPGSRRGPTPYLVAALTATLVGDVSISTLPTLFPALQGERLDALLLVANSLFIAALVHRDAGRIADSDAVREMRLHPARVMFLGIALMVVPILGGLNEFHTSVSRLSLIGSVVLLTSLILIRFVSVVREQERIRAALAHQAEHDQLTGLSNRPALRARLEIALLRARGYGPVVFYLDLNGFKQINDRYGHASGDVVLVEFARRLLAAVRPQDTAARLGGDEFVVLCEDLSGEADALAVADRLAALVAEPVCCGEDSYRIGVSIGMASMAETGRADADVLLATADRRMYAEKLSR